MRKYNIMRPILIILVGFLVKNLATSVSLLLGAAPEVAENIGFIGMIIAAILTYMRLTRNSRKP